MFFAVFRLFCEVFDTQAALQQTNPELRRTITVSYAEVYNESVLDLLCLDVKAAGVRSSCEAHFPSTAGLLTLDNTAEFQVNSPEDMCKYKEHGDQVRRARNHHRLSCCSAALSHTVFSIRIRHSSISHQTLSDAAPGHIHIVDLASSNVSARLHCQMKACQGTFPCPPACQLLSCAVI